MQPGEQLRTVEQVFVIRSVMRCRKPVEEQTGLVDLLVGEQSAEQRLCLLPDRTARSSSPAYSASAASVQTFSTERRLQTQPVSRSASSTSAAVSRRITLPPFSARTYCRSRQASSERPPRGAALCS